MCGEFSIEDVLRVAKAARITLSEEDAKGFARDLSSVLEAFKALESADADSLEPSFYPYPISGFMRSEKEEQDSGKLSKKTQLVKGPRAFDG